MKKTSKKHKRQDLKKKTEEQMKLLPDLVYGAVNVPFTPEELANYAQLLSVMSQGLLQMAQDAVKTNNLEGAEILTARSQLSAVLAGKLSAHYNMGESPSRDVH